MSDISHGSHISLLEAVKLSNDLLVNDADQAGGGTLKKLDVALIGDYSFDQLEYFIRARGSQAGFELSITKGDFGNMVSEILDEDSFLYSRA